MPDKQDVSKQVEEDVSNFVGDHFFSSLRMYKERQTKEELIIDPKVPNLSSISLTPLKIQILSKTYSNHITQLTRNEKRHQRFF